MKWYAVMLKLESSFISKEHGVNPQTGNHLKVDRSHNGENYSVVFKAGSALKQLALDKAQKYRGKLIEVESDFMMRNADIDMNLLSA